MIEDFEIQSENILNNSLIVSGPNESNESNESPQDEIIQETHQETHDPKDLIPSQSDTIENEVESAILKKRRGRPPKSLQVN